MIAATPARVERSEVLFASYVPSGETPGESTELSTARSLRMLLTDAEPIVAVKEHDEGQREQAAPRHQNQQQREREATVTDPRVPVAVSSHRVPPT